MIFNLSKRVSGFRHPTLFILMLLFLSLVVVGSEYDQLGGDSIDYVDSVGGTFLPDWSYTARALSEPKLNPIISDLDNDGTNEIVALDGDTVRIYQGTSLSIVDAYTLPTPSSSDQIYSALQTFDLDADDEKEIILYSSESSTNAQARVYILEYNGSNTVLEYEFPLDSSDTDKKYASILCHDDIKKCVIAHQRGDDVLRLHLFNGTGYLHNVSDISGGSTYCLSQIGTGQVSDHDNDAIEDFWFMSYQKVPPNVLRMHRVQPSGATISESVHFSDNTIGTTVGTTCSVIGRVVTQPLIAEIDGAVSNGKEFVFAGADTVSETFRMYSRTSTGASLDHYPLLLQADGDLMSPPFTADIFPDTGRVDFCVLGFSSSLTSAPNGEAGIDLLCASERTGLFPETEEFITWDISGYNVTLDTGGDHDESRANIVHASSFLSRVEDPIGASSSDIDEIVTSYGVFYADWNLLLNFLEPVIQNPATTQSAVIPVDVANLSKSDLIVLSTTNLYYLDDGFSFTGCASTTNPCIRSGSTIDPSTEAVWQMNTTAEIKIIMGDIDDDKVSSRVFLYYGDANEQATDWSAYFNTGTTVIHSQSNESNTFIANKTGTYTMRIQVRDEREPLSIETLDLSFTVANEGIVKGEVVQQIGQDPDDVDDETNTLPEGATTTDLDDNSIENGLEWAKDRTGLGYQGLWLLVMLAFALYVIVERIPHATALIIVGDGILLMLGTLLGFVGVGTLIGFIVILVFAGLWIFSNRGS